MAADDEQSRPHEHADVVGVTGVKPNDRLVRSVRGAILSLAFEGKRLTWTGVAKRSGVSRSSLYGRSDLRYLVELALEKQACGRFNVQDAVYEQLEDENERLRSAVSRLSSEVRRLSRENSALRELLAR